MQNDTPSCLEYALALLDMPAAVPRLFCWMGAYRKSGLGAFPFQQSNSAVVS